MSAKSTRQNQKYSVLKMTLAAMFLALALVLPFLIGQIPQIGKMLSPMHIPILLCGMICGWQYGLVVGFIAPVLRSVLFGMPAPLYPNALGMAFELATYGAVIGLLYQYLSARIKKTYVLVLYGSLIPAMIVGRIVWGISRAIMLGVTGAKFSWEMFISAALINAIPGIILHLILIPALMAALHESHMLDTLERNK